MKEFAVLSIILLFSLIVPIFVEINTINGLQAIGGGQKIVLADSITKLSFSLSGILMFVFGSALNSRDRYKRIDKLFWFSTVICWSVAFLIFLCTICALFSVSYLVTESYSWLLSSYLLLIVISTLLIFNSLTFALYTLRMVK